MISRKATQRVRVSGSGSVWVHVLAVMPDGRVRLGFEGPRDEMLVERDEIARNDTIPKQSTNEQP